MASPAQEVDDTSVLDHHPLWTTRAAARVEHVGQRAIGHPLRTFPDGARQCCHNCREKLSA
jgi:hypothetical protein